MKQKSFIYLILLGSIIAAFMMFTGGITNTEDNLVSPTLSSFTIGTSSPVIYDKLPFSIQALNGSSEKNKDCTEDYESARGLAGTLYIMQGAKIIDSSNFIFVSESNMAGVGYTGTFVDTVVINNAGNYTATATFRNTSHTSLAPATTSLTFTVGVGSEIPLSAGTYKLSSFTAACASSTLPAFTYTNTSASNNVIINANGTSASMNMNIAIPPSTLALYPCLDTTSYSYNASGNFTIVKQNGAKFFRIEYQNSAFVDFNFTFDGTNLILNYSKNGSTFVLNFVKQ